MSILDDHILKFIWRYSRREQVGVVLLTLLAFPLLYMTLEIPKWIINNALGDSASNKSLFGLMLTPVEYLVALCSALMVLVIMSGLLKMWINTMKGMIGERLIRRLRFSLVSRLLRFPLHHYTSVSPGVMVSTVSSETEPLAGYIGESIALPLFQGGTMVTILIFMFAQNWIFGLVSVVLIPVQGYVIPKLQKEINLLKKDRIRRVRQLSDRIGETVVGASEIRLHGTENYTLAEYSRRFGDLFWVRLEIFRKKYYMKFLNNTIGQVTPFLYYLFGGYLVIKGGLTIGALVAAIAAYRDLTSPWRELLNHYQLHEDAKIKYQQIIAMFDVRDMINGEYEHASEPPGFLPGALRVEGLGWIDQHGNNVLSDVSFQVEQGSSVAIIGGGEEQRSALAQLLSGLDRPGSGQINFGGTSIGNIATALVRTRLSLQGPAPHIFSGTIVENLEYGLNQKKPFIELEDSLSRDVVEALASGNAHPLTTDWVDYHIASQDDAVKNREWYSSVLETIGAEKLIYESGLDAPFDPSDRPELAERLREARQALQQEIDNAGLRQQLVQFEVVEGTDVFSSSVSHRGLTVRDYLLSGRAGAQHAGAEKRLDALIDKVADRLGIRTDLMILSGDSQVGVGGSKLSVAARHTLALGRALMKRPDILIFHDALSPFEEAYKIALLGRIRTLLPNLMVVWIDRELDNPAAFNQFYRFIGGSTIRLEKIDQVP